MRFTSAAKPCASDSAWLSSTEDRGRFVIACEPKPTARPMSCPPSLDNSSDERIFRQSDYFRSRTMEREFEVVLHGATGFTGQIVAEHLQRHYGRELRWAIAGRDATRLASVRAGIGADGLPLIVADAADDAALDALARRTR